MKICLISDSCDRKTGIGKAVFELSDNMIKKGHQVHFIGNYCEDNPNPNLIFHKLFGNKNHLSVSFLSLRYFSEYIIKNENFDLVNSFRYIKATDVFTAQSCHKAGIETRKKYENSISIRESFGLFDRMALSLEKYNYTKGNYRKIIAVSNGVKQEIIKYYNVPEDDIIVIPNGVNLNEFKPVENINVKSKLREKFGFSKDDFILLFVSNEFRRKGLKTVLYSLSLLKKKDLKLIVIGKDNPGFYFELARKLGVFEQILFLGSSANISQYYKLSDIFVFPTFYEAFSLAILEASACGLAILTTKVNGTEDLIKDGYNGYFIQRDPEDLAKKIELFLSDTYMLKKIGIMAHETAKKYSWDIITEKTLNIYNEII
jgi:UDP-glucose:(heptosyl)LPS alpha-1,3-glucosyltransferase